MLLSIVGAKPDKYSEGQTLEQLIAKEAFDLDLIRKCVFDYQNRINVALQATNSGSIEKYTGDVDELIIVDLLIKSMYDSTTYKGKSYFKTACCEIQKDFKARHKRRPFKNIMKYCDKLYVTVMKITSAYELIVNRLKIGRPHQEIGNQTTPAHNNHNQNTKANDDYKSSPNKKKGKVVKKLLASATEFAPCNGCGKDHINPGIGCFLKTHPDFNHSNKKWKESPIGIIYKKAGIDHIAWKQRWDPDTKAFIEYSIPTEATTSQAKNSKKVNFINNINIIDSDIYLTGRVEALKELPETSIVTNCHILLDTGASSNFVNQKFVDLLTHVLNLKTCECLFKICNAFNKCKELKKLISFPLHISDEKTNEHLTINLAAHIVPNLVCDVIIGRRTMSRYQMYDKFNQHLNKLNKYMSSNKGLSHRELLTSNALLGELDNASLPIKNEEPHQIMNNLKYSHMPSDTLIKFTKDQLINTESEDDHIDPYLTKYDLYDDLYSRPIMLHKNETSDHSEDAHEVVSRHHEIPITASENMKSDSNIQPCVIGPVIEGDKYFVNEINKILCKYKHIFQKTVGTIPAKVAPFTLEVDDIKWKVNRNKAGPRIQSVLKEKALEQFIEQALKDGVIEESQAIYVSQVLLIPKKDKSYRFCIDYRALNDASEAMGWPLPRIDNMITRLGLIKPKHFAVLDLTQGYYQTPISVISRDYTAFTTSIGTYRWTRLPMGLKGAPSYFQAKIANTVLIGLIYKICDLYIDDIIIYGISQEDFLHNLDRVFKRLEEFNILLNPKKAKIGLSQIEYVGHTINENGVTISKEKRDYVLDVPIPQIQKALKSFLGLVSYFRNHLKDHSTIVQPLQQMITPYVPAKKLKWNPQLIELFYQVQKSVNEAPSLFFLDYDAPVYLHTDASDFGIGAYLFQIKDNKELPVSFISKSLNKTEIKWSVPEKECYAIFFAVVKLEYLLRDIHFTLRTDHRNLTFLNDSFQSKVKRWKLAIQHFNFDIEHIPGKENIVADSLSRLVKIPKAFKEEEEPLFVIGEETLKDVAYFRLEDKIYKRLDKVHNSTIGHLGVDKMLMKLKKNNIQWKGMRMDCKKFIFQCACCQKMTALKYPIHIHPFTRASYSPMDIIALDTIGPLPEDTLGNKYIITIIDCFSRIVELVPIKDTTAIPAANALIQWICRYGIPSQIVSDNGTQYSNELIKTISQLFNIDQHLIQAYSHEENAIVERANKEVGRHIRAIVQDKRILDTWSPMLPLVQRIINSQVHSSIGVSPIQLMFGNAIDLDRFLISDDSVEDQINIVKSMNNQRYIDWADTMILKQHTLMDVALSTQLDNDIYHIQSNIKQDHNELTEFPINSYVLQRYENEDGKPPHKLNTPLRGPHKVVGRYTRTDGPDVYTVQNLSTNKLEDFKVNDLRPFNFDPQRINPLEIALSDQQLFVVDEILEHTGSPKKRQNMMFKVKWKGFDDPTWVPWDNVKNNNVLHQYLRHNNLQRLIPIQIRRSVFSE